MLHHFEDKLVLTDFTQNDFEKNLLKIYDLHLKMLMNIQCYCACINTKEWEDIFRGCYTHISGIEMSREVCLKSSYRVFAFRIKARNIKTSSI